MTITIDYSDEGTPQYVINVPRTDMPDVTGGGPTEIRELDINIFRQALNDLMDDETGMVYPINHVHTAPLIIAGVTLARVVEVMSPFVVRFEDLPYNVNVVGGNSNISDVTVKNLVGVNTANSAGLTDFASLQNAVTVIRRCLTNKFVTDPLTGIATIYDDDGNVMATSQMYEDAAGTQPYRGRGSERREKFT